MRVVAILFAVFTCVTLLQVIGRNLAKASLLWTADVAVMCFVWTVFLGAAVATRRWTNYSVDIFPDHLVRFNAVLKILADAGTAVAIYTLVVGGFDFLPMAFSRSLLALDISEGYFFLSIPVAGTFMALFLAEVVRDDVQAVRDAFAGLRRQP